MRPSRRADYAREVNMADYLPEDEPIVADSKEAEEGAALPFLRKRSRWDKVGEWERSERPGFVARGLTMVQRNAYANGYARGFHGPHTGKLRVRPPGCLPPVLKQAWLDGCAAGARVRAEGLGLMPKGPEAFEVHDDAEPRRAG